MRAFKIPPIALISIAAAGALAACGSTPSKGAAAGGAAPTKSAPGACTLLTQADLRKAAGTIFNNGRLERSEQTPYGKYTVCTWSEKAHPLNVVRVSVWDEPSAFDISKETAGKVQDSSGVGEKSFTAPFASVFALTNGHTLFTQYYSPTGSDAEHLPVSIALAKAAAARL